MATCIRIRQDANNAATTGKQGTHFFHGISKQSAASEHLCMHVVNIPPQGRTTAHYHASHETAIYVLSGEATTWYGADLQEEVVTIAGDLLYIPAGVPHVTMNSSPTEPAAAVIARTDPNEQESVVLLPQLDTAFAARLAQNKS